MLIDRSRGLLIDRSRGLSRAVRYKVCSQSVFILTPTQRPHKSNSMATSRCNIDLDDMQLPDLDLDACMQLMDEVFAEEARARTKQAPPVVIPSKRLVRLTEIRWCIPAAAAAAVKAPRRARSKYHKSLLVPNFSRCLSCKSHPLVHTHQTCNACKLLPVQ